MKNFKKFLSYIYIYTSKPQTKFINKKGFTLVELIIVITILAILGTVAFSSYRGITESARDTSRLATLKELEKGLESYKVQTGNYPLPEGQIHTGVLSLSGNEIDYSYMGVVGENVSSQLKLNSVPLDPLSDTNYIYATNKNRTRYQIATVFERLEAYKKPGQNMKNPGQNMRFNIFDKQELCLIQETYANNSSYKAKVLGNHKTEVKIEDGGKIWLTTVPSMIFDPDPEILSGYILNSSGSYLIVNKGKNLPYKLNSNDTTANQNGNEIMQVLRENTKAKIVSIDITEIVNASNGSDRITKINALFGTGGTDTSKVLLSSFGVKEEDLANTSAITSKMETIITGGTTSNYTPPTNSCASRPAYTNASFTDLNPTSVGQARQNTNSGNPCYWTCGSGKTLVGSDCVSENCSGTDPNTINGVSNVTSTAGGEWNYNATGGLCTFACNTNYTWNGTNACTDQTAPTGGDFTMPATTNSTGITLTITCPTDALNSTPIQLAYGNTASPTNWTNCTTGNYNHNLDVGDGSKTIYVRFKDNVGNITIDITKNITLNTTVSGSCTGIIENAVYFNNTTSYSLVDAPAGTSLTGSYLATPTINTCQYKCATNYTWNGTNACTDQTPPTITSVISSSPVCNTVRFTINGASDTIALHSTPYSFDGGSTWQAGNTKDYTTTNQTISANQIKVKDTIGNIYTYTSSSNGTSASCCTPNGTYTYGACDSTACGTNCNRAKYNSCGTYVGVDTYYNGACCVANIGSQCYQSAGIPRSWSCYPDGSVGGYTCSCGYLTIVPNATNWQGSFCYNNSGYINCSGDCVVQ